MGSSLHQRSPQTAGDPKAHDGPSPVSRPLAGPPAGPPSPGRPYLAVQPREAAAGREARGRGRPGHGTGSARWRRRFVSGAARLAQPRERATRTEGGGGSRTVHDPRARPFNPSQPTRAGPAPSFIPPSDWPAPTRHAPWIRQAPVGAPPETS